MTQKPSSVIHLEFMKDMEVGSLLKELGPLLTLIFTYS